MNPIFAGVQINSALYLLAVLVGGMYFHNAVAIRLDIAAIGVTYLSYLVQTFPVPLWVMQAVVGLSIILGAGAGIALL